MAKNQIFTASECSITAWLADATGLSPAGGPVWIGAALESLGVKRSRTLLRRWPTEATRRRALAIDESVVLTFRRLWCVRKSDRTDFNPALSGHYILSMSWVDKRSKQWVRRVFYDCVPVELGLESEGLMQHYGDTVFECGGYTADSGTGTAPGSGTDAGTPPATALFTASYVYNETTGFWHKWRARTNDDGVLEYYLDPVPA